MPSATNQGANVGDSATHPPPTTARITSAKAIAELVESMQTTAEVGGLTLETELRRADRSVGDADHHDRGVVAVAKAKGIVFLRTAEVGAPEVEQGPDPLADAGRRRRARNTIVAG